MYKAKFLGYTIRLTWQELRSLKMRFNLKNFKQSYVGSVSKTNKRHCVLCTKYRANNCDSCPLYVYQDSKATRVGCYTMMMRMLNRTRLGFACGPPDITYDSKQGRNNIEKISVFLERFKKV